MRFGVVDGWGLLQAKAAKGRQTLGWTVAVVITVSSRRKPTSHSWGRQAEQACAQARSETRRVLRSEADSLSHSRTTSQDKTPRAQHQLGTGNRDAEVVKVGRWMLRGRARSNLLLLLSAT
jgi:hypothetical protein